MRVARSARGTPRVCVRLESSVIGVEPQCKAHAQAWPVRWSPIAVRAKGTAMLHGFTDTNRRQLNGRIRATALIQFSSRGLCGRVAVNDFEEAAERPVGGFEA